MTGQECWNRSTMRRRNWLQTVGAGALTLGYANSTTQGSARATPQQDIALTLVEKDEEAGFNFPYYLYAPEDSRDKPLLVEPVNSGGCDDDFQKDLDAAESTAKNGVARLLSDELRVPLIVPVFANPCEGEFWQRFIQTLDTETMHIESGKFERIDLQLLAMVEDARSRLGDAGIDAPEQVMMNGFSASGNFVNNFSVLHPDRVSSVTAGAINGMATLPTGQAQDQTVNYQIGVADLETLVGNSFDSESWQDVAQFCYIGADERPPYDDTLPYRDVWNEKQATKAAEVYGEDMQRQRMVFSEKLYEESETNARFEVYDRRGHEYSPESVNDALLFHCRHNDIPAIQFVEGHVGGSQELSLDVFVPEGTQFEVRAFVNETDVTESVPTVVGGVSNRVSVPLSGELELGDSITVGVLEQGDANRSNAIHSGTQTVGIEAEFVSVPEPGNTKIEVSYALSEKANYYGLGFSPDSPTLEWQQAKKLTSLNSGDSGTETFTFDRYDEGVPFTAGDEIELTFTESGQRGWQKTTLETVTVGGSKSSVPGSCDAVGDVTHEEVDISFTSPPVVNSDTVDLACSVEGSYGKSVDMRLIPDTGSGRWGIGVRYDVLDAVDPGESASDSYEVEPITFAPADTPALGEIAEVRAYPEDWGRMNDFVAAECAVISGVRFTEPPEATADEVRIRYHYPETMGDAGEITLHIDGSQVATLAGISPGTTDDHAFSLSGDDSVPEGATVEVSLGADTTDPLDSASRTALPENVADVAFDRPPANNEQRVKLEYELAGSYQTDRVATLRLYTQETSAWGVYLGTIQPGDAGTETIDINPDEICVPFDVETGVTVAVVDWDDPYANTPLATATQTVVEQAEGPLFAVSNVKTNPVSVEQGADFVDITATITNTGTAEGTQTVTVLAEEDDAMTEQANKSVSIDESTGQTVEFLDLNTADFDVGETTVVVESEDDSASTTVTVTDGGENEAPPALPGEENPPKDIDGDGLYEDINGDGELTVGDVQLFFTHRNADVVRANAEFFNFSGEESGTVTNADVEALYQLLQSAD